MPKIRDLKVGDKYRYRNINRPITIFTVEAILSNGDIALTYSYNGKIHSQTVDNKSIGEVEVDIIKDDYTKEIFIQQAKNVGPVHVDCNHGEAHMKVKYTYDGITDRIKNVEVLEVYVVGD